MTFLKKITRAYILSETAAAAGGIFLAEDTGRICVARRSGLVQDPYTWSTWGGKLDKDETSEETVRKEILEEAGFIGALDLKHVYTSKTPQLIYDTYWIIVGKEFKPKLNWENIDYRWCTLDTIPQPMHLGLKAALPHLKRTKPKIK